MTDRDLSRRPDHFPSGDTWGKSIFPTFNVNEPMPRHTAVPGSYNKPAQPAADATASRPASPTK